MMTTKQLLRNFEANTARLLNNPTAANQSAARKAEQALRSHLETLGIDEWSATVIVNAITHALGNETLRIGCDRGQQSP